MSPMDSQRIRRIAILVSTVDSQAASQILLQLPSEVAEAVRNCIRNLGDVTEKERSEILQEFQQAEEQTAAAPTPDTPAIVPANPQTQIHQFATESILRVCHDERPLVIAVILNQLPKEQATELLARLPEEKALQTLGAFQNLGEMQPKVRRDIESFLHQSLLQHQQQLQQASQNKRRLEELLKHAPKSVQQNWQAATLNQHASAKQNAPSKTSSSNHQLITHFTTATSDQVQPLVSPAASPPPLRTQPVSPDPHVSLVESRLRQIERNTEEFQRKSVDRSLLQLEFEQLLELPQQVLQNLLTQADPEIVLLALAGASHVFIGRLELMIEPEDFANLNQRIRELGAMRITDIDEAQTRLIKLAKSWRSQPGAQLKKAS